MKFFKNLIISIGIALPAVTFAHGTQQIDLAKLDVLGRLNYIDHHLKKDLRTARTKLAKGITASTFSFIIPVIGWMHSKEAMNYTKEVNKIKRQIKNSRREIRKSQKILQSIIKAGVRLKESKKLKLNKYVRNFYTTIGGTVSEYKDLTLFFMQMNAEGMNGLFADATTKHAFYGEFVNTCYKLRLNHFNKHQENQQQDKNGVVRRVPASSVDDESLIIEEPKQTVQKPDLHIQKPDLEIINSVEESSSETSTDHSQETSVSSSSDTSDDESSDSDSQSFSYVGGSSKSA